MIVILSRSRGAHDPHEGTIPYSKEENIHSKGQFLIPKGMLLIIPKGNP